jgi:hypothetical protein
LRTIKKKVGVIMVFTRNAVAHSDSPGVGGESLEPQILGRDGNRIRVTVVCVGCHAEVFGMCKDSSVQQRDSGGGDKPVAQVVRDRTEKGLVVWKMQSSP